MKKLIIQIIKFGGVGSLCFVIDFLILTLLHEAFFLNVLISSAFAFAISTVVNYILSVKFIFTVPSHSSHQRNLTFFVVFSIFGLIITELLMHVGVNVLKINYMIVKVSSTAFVMVFNFATRKIFLEKE